MNRKLWMMLCVFSLAVCAFANAGAEEMHCNCDFDEWVGDSYAYCNEPDLCINCGLRLWDGEEATYVYHYYSCADPSKCKYCGEPYDYTQGSADPYYESRYGISHDYSVWKYKSGYSCALCCSVCEATWDVTSHLVTGCTGICERCGEKIPDEFVEEEHQFDCTGVCKACGEKATADDTLPSHSYLCSGVCEDCGAKAPENIYLPSHYVVCTDTSNTCIDCGMKLDDGMLEDAAINHVKMAKKWDGKEHWVICEKCGYEGEHAQHHQMMCDEPVCDECGGEIDAENYGVNTGEWYGGGHVSLVYQPADDEYHHIICEYCQEYEDMWLEHEIACNGICVHCGYEPASWDGEVMDHAILCNGKCAYCGETLGEEGNHSWIDAFDDRYHWEECEICGEKDEKQEHYRYCDDGNECHECGEAYFGPAIAHLYEMYAYVDKDGCRLQCAECGEVMGEKVPHQVWCYSTGHCCDLCGGYCEEPAVRHNTWGDTFESDATHHWTVCSECGEEMEKESHLYHCEDENVCSECGREDLPAEMAVHSPRYYTYKSVGIDSHQQICMDCNGVAGTFAHVDKDGDKLCNLCGGSMVEKESLGEWAQERYCIFCEKFTDHTGGYDLDSHWGYCAVCGAEEVQPHQVSCDNEEEKKCSVCECTGVNYEDLEHSGEHVYLWDENTHWEACSVCEVKFGEAQAHSTRLCTEEDTCTVCGCTELGDKFIQHSEDDISYTSKDAEYHEKRCDACDTLLETLAHEDADENKQCDVCKAAMKVELAPGEWAAEMYCYDCRQDTLHIGSVDTCEYYSHVGVCTVCGAEEDDDHIVTCMDPDSCAVCGMMDCGYYELDHNREWDVYFDAVTHGSHCLDCGKVFYRERHRLNCSVSNACLDCGGTELMDPEADHVYGDYEHDQTYHWVYCTGCKALIEKSYHTASCTDDEQCMVCGITGLKNPPISHDWTDYQDNDRYRYDGEAHWYYCRDCEAKGLYSSEHDADCAAPNVCTTCGYTECEKAEINHNYRYNDDYAYDDKNHWIPCRDCDARVWEEEHTVRCDAPDTCRECGATGLENVAYAHQWNWDVMEYDKEFHWPLCEICGEPGEKERHYGYCNLENGCDGCDATDMKNPDIRHEWNEDGDGMVSMGFDETHHWITCRNCDGKGEKSTHYAYCCFGQNSCTDCLAPYSGNDIRHLGDETKYQSNEDYHWTICEYCEPGVIIDQETHTANDAGDQCAVCGEKMKKEIPGDANEDEGVNVLDALQVLRFVNGWGNAIDEKAADVNDDGKVNADDALILLKYVAEYGVTLK